MRLFWGLWTVVRGNSITLQLPEMGLYGEFSCGNDGLLKKKL